MAGTVGQGFGAMTNRTVINHIPKSPMDKSTIVSIFPLDFAVNNPTVFPGVFEIPAPKEGDYSILVIAGSSWFKEQQEGMPTLEIPVNSFNLAESVINDYCRAMLEYNKGVAEPGLFFIPGEFTKESIKKYVGPNLETFDSLLAKTRALQKEWYTQLVRIADIDWVTSNNNPSVINKLSRIAAEKLNLTKPWMADFTQIQKQNCPACGLLVDPNYAICPNCKYVVNKEKAKLLGLAS